VTKAFLYFLVAVQLLTIIPVKFKKEFKLQDKDTANSTLFFPLVGLVVGVLLFLIYFIIRKYFTPEVTSVFILAGWVYITGALHIDGLADTIDGLSGGKDKEQTLSIMKDTHIGAKGAAGIAILLLVKLFLIVQIILLSKPRNLIYAPVLSRWGMVIGSFCVPYARKQGMGKFSSLITYPHIISATLITLILGVFLLDLSCLIPFIGVGGFSLLFSFYLKRKIEGFTGDTLGALNEMGEVVALLIGSLV